ncbi:MAG TPA: hypothetical protein VK778_02325 [Solirubrobacteraceae bacterium]|nr:hypothetical protein [Solirubrobacteraceae bacterium]
MSGRSRRSAGLVTGGGGVDAAHLVAGERHAGRASAMPAAEASVLSDHVTGASRSVVSRPSCQRLTRLEAGTYGLNVFRRLGRGPSAVRACRRP